MILVALGALPVMADYPSAVSNLNPVGYWRFDEPRGGVLAGPTGIATNYGSVGSAGDGAYWTMPMGSDPSAVMGDTAPHFNPPGYWTGIDNYIEIPSLPALATNTSMSIEIWCLRKEATGIYASIFCGGYNSERVSAERQGWILWRDNASTGEDMTYFLRVISGDSGTTNNLSNLNYNSRLFGGTNLTVGIWDHLVYTWDTNTIKGYINGYSLWTNTFSDGKWYVPWTNDPIRIGADSKFTPGTISDDMWLAHAAIYPHELTHERVLAHYAATNDAAGYRATILADNPVGYWPLNDSGPCSDTPGIVVTNANAGSWGSSADGTFITAWTNFNTGAPGVPYAGFAGTSIAISGGTNRITVAPQALATNRFTITGWAKLSGTAGTGYLLNSPAPDAQAALGFTGGATPGMVSNQVGVAVAGSVGGTTPAVYLPAEEWAFVAMVVTPDDTVVYVNGLATTNLAVNTSAGAHDFSVAELLLGDGFTGYLSELAVFDYALTPAQVQTLYASAGIVVEPTTLGVSIAGPTGELTVSGNTVRGFPLTLWQSTNLVSQEWTRVGTIQSDALTGDFRFLFNDRTEPQVFYKIK